MSRLNGDGEAASSPVPLAELLREGKEWLAKGRRDLAVVSLVRAVESHPDSAEAHIYLGYSLSAPETTVLAVEHLKKGLALDPSALEPYEVLGTLLQRLGRFDEAIEAFHQVIDRDPDMPGPYFGIVRSKRITEADRPLLDRMVSILSRSDLTPEQQTMLNFGLGKAFDELGDYDPAMRHFDEANRLSEALYKARGGGFDPAAHRADIDMLIRTFTPELFQRYRSAGVESDLPVLIVGMMRSGTTLVEQILSCHSRVTGAGELTFWLERDAGALLLGLTQGGFDASLANRIAENYRRLLRTFGPKALRVTDKQPTNYLHVGLIHLLFPNARFIHCQRDPADNCLSLYTTPFSHPHPDFVFNRDNIAFAYRQYARLMDHWRSVIPADRFLDVSYSDLVMNPSEVVPGALDFIGVEWEDACLRPEDNPRIVRTPSRWQVRQPVYTSSVGRWKHYEPWLGALRLDDLVVS